MQRPLVNKETIADILLHRYGFRVVQQTTFKSYDDVNVHVCVAVDSDVGKTGRPSNDGYVLKILNSLDSQKVDFVGAMHGAIEHVVKHGIITPQPVPTLDGAAFVMETLPSELGDTHPYLVRLFEYIPGEILEGKPYTPKICFQVGQLAGEVDAALKGFSHSSLAGHSRHWNLANVATMDDKVECIEDEQDRRLVNDVIQQFKDNVIAKTDQLQKGVVHADLNEGNILVRKNSSNPPDDLYDVSGVLDFGDLVREFHVYEVAIAAAYTMIESRHGVQPLDAAGHVIAGYLSKLNLPYLDCTVLKECIAGRLAQSFIYGAHAHKLDPSNTSCLHTSNIGWPILRELWGMSKPALYKRWANILKEYNIETKLENV